MTRTSPAIEISSLSVNFANRQVLEGIDLIVPANRITLISGPSGSGKSTLLRTLCRMNDQVTGFSLTGSVNVFGNNIYSENVDLSDLRRRVGLIFQKSCVFPKSIYENVIFALNYHRPKERSFFPGLAEQALCQAGLWHEVKDRLQSPAAELSQGQQQRLALARTLALEPEVLLLDEPTASLDPDSTQVIEELALSLKSSRTLVWVTHDPAQADRIADCQVVLSSGKLVQQENKIRKIS